VRFVCVRHHVCLRCVAFGTVFGCVVTFSFVQLFADYCCVLPFDDAIFHLPFIGWFVRFALLLCLLFTLITFVCCGYVSSLLFDALRPFTLRLRFVVVAVVLFGCYVVCFIVAFAFVCLRCLRFSVCLRCCSLLLRLILLRLRYVVLDVRLISLRSSLRPVVLVGVVLRCLSRLLFVSLCAFVTLRFGTLLFVVTFVRCLLRCCCRVWLICLRLRCRCCVWLRLLRSLFVVRVWLLFVCYTLRCYVTFVVVVFRCLFVTLFGYVYRLVVVTFVVVCYVCCCVCLFHLFHLRCSLRSLLRYVTCSFVRFVVCGLVRFVYVCTFVVTLIFTRFTFCLFVAVTFDVVRVLPHSLLRLRLFVRFTLLFAYVTLFYLLRFLAGLILFVSFGLFALISFCLFRLFVYVCSFSRSRCLRCLTLLLLLLFSLFVVHLPFTRFVCSFVRYVLFVFTAFVCSIFGLFWLRLVAFLRYFVRHLLFCFTFV